MGVGAAWAHFWTSSWSTLWAELVAVLRQPPTVYDFFFLVFCIGVLIRRSDKLSRRVSALEKQAKETKPPPG